MYSLSAVARTYARLALVCIFGLAAAGSVGAQGNSYVPEEGQEGKDVIWLPTEMSIVDTMLNMARVGPRDVVIDLGSGDGRTVIAAARLGAAKAMGVEFNPDMVGYARSQAEKAGVGEKVQFIRGDIFEADFSEATVLTMFLLDDINLRLRPKILEMKPGTRIVTNTFTMGDWSPDMTTEVQAFCEEFCTAHLWYVPAKLSGRWSSRDGELVIDQTFQTFTGTIGNGSERLSLSGGKVKGYEFKFMVGPTTVVGRLEGNRLVGMKTSADGKRSEWEAARQN